MSLKAPKVIETESGNVPFVGSLKTLPKGLTETPNFSKRSKWDAKISKYISRTRYNEPKHPEDKAKFKRFMETLQDKK